MTFVALVNDDDQLNSNLLRSPCLREGTGHQLLIYRDQMSAADGDALLDIGSGFPSAVDGLDEILLAVRRESGLRADPDLGFHLYGVDLCLTAERGLTNVVLDAPAYHNSLFAEVDSAFHASRERLLAKWPQIRPLHSNMGQLDAMTTPLAPVPGPDQDDEIAELRARLKDTEDRLAAVLNSHPPGGLGTFAGRLLRRR